MIGPGKQDLNKDEGEDEMQVDDEEDEEETEEVFLKRLDKFVQGQLSKASGSRRDDYKDALVYQARKDLITDFLKSTITKKCQNLDCGQQVFLLLASMTMLTCMLDMRTLSGKRAIPK